MVILFLPAHVQTNWQLKFYQFIVQQLHITVGMNGPLPFFTAVLSTYFTIIGFIIGSLILIYIFKNFGMDKRYQDMVYSHLLSLDFSNSKRLQKLANNPVFKFLYTLFLILFCLAMGILILVDPDISYAHGRRGALIGLSYQYRLGVIIWEFFGQCFLIASLVSLVSLSVYLLNIIRGLGNGQLAKVVIKPDISYKNLTKNQKKRFRKKEK